jgi:hypothetical protein
MRNKMKLGWVLVAGLVALLGCSGEAPQPALQAPPPAPAVTTSQPAPTPAPTAEPAAPPTAPAAGGEPSAASTEKHRFQVLNYAGTGVTLI